MISAFRGLLVLFCIALLGIGAVVLRYTAMIFPAVFIKDENKKIKTCSDILRKAWVFYLGILKLFRIAEIHIEDFDKIKNIKNSIIISTHPSLLDIVILIANIPYTTCFAAEKIGRNPFFRPMADLLFVLESRNIDEWLEKSMMFLNRGFNIVIFPMGSRHQLYEHPKIRKGAMLLAQKSGKNIVMLKIENDFDFLAKSRPAYRISRKIVSYKVSYLDEINTEELRKKYPDEVTFKHKASDIAAKTLYGSIETGQN